MFHADIWREFVLLGHWIGDSINIRWAELTRELSRGSLQLDEIVHLFMVSTAPERNVGAVRDLYSETGGLECVWSGKVLSGDFDVDHAIPFSLRHDNSLWNLFPADWKKPLYLAFSEAVETTAVRRGVERWEP